MTLDDLKKAIDRVVDDSFQLEIVSGTGLQDYMDTPAGYDHYTIYPWDGPFAEFQSSETRLNEYTSLDLNVPINRSQGIFIGVRNHGTGQPMAMLALQIYSPADFSAFSVGVLSRDYDTICFRPLPDVMNAGQHGAIEFGHIMKDFSENPREGRQALGIVLSAACKTLQLLQAHVPGYPLFAIAQGQKDFDNGQHFYDQMNVSLPMESVFLGFPPEKAGLARSVSAGAEKMIVHLGLKKLAGCVSKLSLGPIYGCRITELSDHYPDRFPLEPSASQQDR